MLYSRGLKRLTTHNETVLLVKANGTLLRVQKYMCMPLLAGVLKQGFQDGTADTLTAPGLQHGHAPDLPVRLDPACPDWLALAVTHENVVTASIMLIQFEQLGHALLDDKHGSTHGGECRLLCLPGAVLQLD